MNKLFYKGNFGKDVVDVLNFLEIKGIEYIDSVDILFRACCILLKNADIGIEDISEVVKDYINSDKFKDFYKSIKIEGK